MDPLGNPWWSVATLELFVWLVPTPALRTLRQFHGPFALASMTAVAGLAMWLVLAIAPLGPPGVPQMVARASVPGEWQFVLTQTPNYTTEPYTVSFYSKHHDEPWEWHYVDHEDVRWGHGAIRIDRVAHEARIYRGRRLVGRHDLVNGWFFLGDEPDTRAGTFIAGHPLDRGKPNFLRY